MNLETRSVRSCAHTHCARAVSSRQNRPSAGASCPHPSRFNRGDPYEQPAHLKTLVVGFEEKAASSWQVRAATGPLEFSRRMTARSGAGVNEGVARSLTTRLLMGP